MLLGSLDTIGVVPTGVLSVGNMTGSWILLTIHFSTLFMNLGADILAALPSTNQV